MNPADVIVLLIVVLIAAAAFYGAVRYKKKGGCSGSCEGCAGSSLCKKKRS